MRIKQISDYTAQEIAFASESASAIFENQNKNVMALYSASEVYEAMAKLVKLEGIPDSVKNDFSVQSLVQLMRQNFMTLLLRGALDRYVKFAVTPEAQLELDKLAADCRESVPDGTGDSTTIVDSNPNLIAECIADFRTFAAKEFKQKWMNNPERRAVYDDAVNQGAI